MAVRIPLLVLGFLACSCAVSATVFDFLIDYTTLSCGTSDAGACINWVCDSGTAANSDDNAVCTVDTSGTECSEAFRCTIASPALTQSSWAPASLEGVSFFWKGSKEPGKPSCAPAQTAQLVSASGTLVGAEQSVSTWSTAESYGDELGGATDTWGSSVTWSDTFDADFGVNTYLVHAGQACATEVDHFRLQLHASTDASAVSALPAAAFPSSTITVIGSDFVDANELAPDQIRCLFQSVTPVTGSFVSATAVTCVVPDLGGAAIPYASVQVSLDGGSSYTAPVNFTYTSPTVATVLPSSDVHIGDQLAIAGTSLPAAGTYQCRFDGSIDVPATRASAISATCDMPFIPGAGPVNLNPSLQLLLDTLVLPNTITTLDFDPPYVSAIAAADVMTKPDDVITVTGERFGAAAGSPLRCLFQHGASSSSAWSDATWQSPTALTCPVPVLSSITPASVTVVDVSVSFNQAGDLANQPGAIALNYSAPAQPAPEEPPVGLLNGLIATLTPLLPVLVVAGGVVVLGALVAVVIIGRSVAHETEVQRLRLMAEAKEGEDLAKQLAELDRRSKVFGKYRWTRMSIFAPNASNVKADAAQPPRRGRSKSKNNGKSQSKSQSKGQSKGRSGSVHSKGGSTSQGKKRSGSVHSKGGSGGGSGSGRKRAGSAPGPRPVAAAAAGGKKAKAVLPAPRQAPKSEAWQAPTALIDVMWFIEDRCSVTPGVFRDEVNTAETKSILKALQSDPDNNFLPGQTMSALAAATALRTYLLATPDGLLPPSMRADVKEKLKGKDQRAVAQAVTPLLLRLPARKLDTLKHLCFMCCAVVRQSATSKVKLQDLTKALGIAIVAGSKDDALLGERLLTICIQFASAVFATPS